MFAAFEKRTGSGLRVSLLWAPIQTLMPSLSLPGAMLGMRAVAPNKAGVFLDSRSLGLEWEADSGENELIKSLQVTLSVCREAVG